MRIDRLTQDSDEDIQPTDYEDHYNDATDTYATDDLPRSPALVLDAPCRPAII